MNDDVEYLIGFVSDPCMSISDARAVVLSILCALAVRDPGAARDTRRAVAAWRKGGQPALVAALTEIGFGG